MANIREIAKLAGVSVATVSRVLNNHPYVREEKRHAVQQAMDSLDYRRNLTAIHLSKGTTNLIGVVLPSIDIPYFSNIIEGIAEEGLQHNLQLVLVQTNYEISKELDALELLRGNLIDGLIFTSRAVSLDIIKQYNGNGPVVLCEDSDQLEFPSISIPHEQAFQRGLDYLISKGHSRIAYTLGRKTGANSQKRTTAYQAIMKKINEPIRDDWVFDKCLTITDGRQIIHKYNRLKEKPTAFLATNDQVAAGLIFGAQNDGLTVPYDIAVLSFDNQPISEVMNISTIDIPIKEIGRKAVQTLVEGKSAKKQKISLPFQLIERKTV
ncbi:LacI family DNA-binding transcriptional regulator [Sediminibacillus albus]|uniref:DNA-binding transcriptional regulator, LacI/PurR family n=1 Tax=Sediminibacillus albus TaxID=407036 RepID=A0A1G8WJX1_9BACI|nr:LacI family DNA-binding transcriptional regulator [Sediminibacillus albus]SDJ78373.1 DNA-binding transcriptional regulator, LacI/PurR family [Sediminibacillus albus]